MKQKDWISQKCRHYEKELFKNGNQAELAFYSIAVNKTNEEISKVWAGVFDRIETTRKKLDAEDIAFKKEQMEILLKDIDPICIELAMLDEKRNSLLLAKREIEDNHIQQIKNRFNESSIKFNTIAKKGKFCYTQYVRNISKEFEDKMIPR